MSRLAELLGTTGPVVLVTERGVEFDLTDATVEDLTALAFAVGMVDSLPEAEEPRGG